MLEKIEVLKPKKETLNGTTLYGDVQELYAEERKNYTVIGTYVHAVYKPINSEDIVQLKKEIPLLTDDYLSFLNKYNGLNLFSDSFCLYGYGRILSNGKYITSRDPSIVLPYHLGDYNKGVRNIYIIGTFCECKLLNDVDNNCYLLFDKNNVTIFQWDNIQSLIMDCIDKLSCYYCANGKVKAPNIIGNLIFNKTTKLI